MDFISGPIRAGIRADWPLALGASFLLSLAGCAEKPKKILVAGGKPMAMSSCFKSWLLLTQRACETAVLKQCKPGATVAFVKQGGRPRYIERIGWTTQTIWTVYVRDC